jgi:serine/threonine protein kinase
MPPLLGEVQVAQLRIGTFDIADRLGSGGFGVVYKALSIANKEKCAIKVLENARTEEAVLRFRREVRIQSNLSHPNIMPILEFDLHSEPPWCAMPLASGSLRDRLLRSPGGIGEGETKPIFRQILAGVGHAHEKGVIHRDLKPENVLDMPDGRVVVGDFGLGRLMERDTTTITRTDYGIGTLEYCAPEQLVNPKAADARADIYSLGKIFYEMLTGRLPWPTVETRLLPDKFEYLVSRCVRNDRDERFSSIRQLIRELDLLERDEDFQKPEERINQTLREVLEFDPSRKPDMRKLNDLFERERANAALYRDVLPRLPEPLLRGWISLFRRGFIDAFVRFDQQLGKNLDFECTDTVADLYAMCFDVCEEVEVQKMIVVRLLDMGYWHNRYYVRDVFWRTVASIAGEKRGLAIAAVEAINANRPAAKWTAEEISDYPDLLPIIRKAFEAG